MSETWGARGRGASELTQTLKGYGQRSAHGGTDGNVMIAPIEVSILDNRDRSFSEQIDQLRQLLGMPNNPALFPGHFLKATFPKMGGLVARLRTGQHVGGVAFLFPRALDGDGRTFILRLHRVSSNFDASAAEIAAAVERQIGIRASCYEPTSPDVTYAGQTSPGSGLEIDRPTASDAAAVRDLQQKIWHPDSPDALYPSDLHSLEFCPGTSLIAKVDGAPVGFLFGFNKFGGSKLSPMLAERHADAFRLESQLMGVLPEYRGRGISVALKLRQAELATRDGVHVINWTFDPLQYQNAVLNFGRLGGIAFDFYPNYYDFSNDLNQAPASRLSVSWLINSSRVRGPASTSRPREVDLRSLPDIVRLNLGPRVVATPDDAQRIAIEVPADWTRLQRDKSQLELVRQWRATTDQILARYLGHDEGQYALTSAGRDKDRFYLIGERVDEALLGSIGE